MPMVLQHSSVAPRGSQARPNELVAPLDIFHGQLTMSRIGNYQILSEKSNTSIGIFGIRTKHTPAVESVSFFKDKSERINLPEHSPNQGGKLSKR